MADHIPNSGVMSGERGALSYYFDNLSDGYNILIKESRQVLHRRREFYPRFDAVNSRLPFQYEILKFVADFQRDIDVYYRMPCI